MNPSKQKQKQNLYYLFTKKGNRAFTTTVKYYTSVITLAVNMNTENSLYPHGVGRLVVRFLCDGAVEGCVADFLTWVFL